jgi:hypothetical protein
MSAHQSERSLIERPGNSTGKLLADFLTQGEAASELRVCERTLDRWRTLGEGPPVTKLGRRILYRRSSLLKWLTAQEQAGRPPNVDGFKPCRRSPLNHQTGKEWCHDKR